MLLGCPKTCKLQKTTTDASLDIVSNEAVCNDCGEIIPVSSFAKNSMKITGDVIKEKKKAFLFDCNTCKNKVEAQKTNGRIVGKGCETNNCMLNITKAMRVAIESIKQDTEFTEGE